MEKKPSHHIASASPAPQSTGASFALVGFILSLAALFLVWIPIFNVMIWAVGLIFSFLAIRRARTEFAVAGLIVSLIIFLLLLAYYGFFIALFSGFFNGSDNLHWEYIACRAHGG